MNKVREKFAALRAERKKAFIAYVTCGDPDLRTTARLVAELGEKALTEPKLKSPAQIEKVLPKGRKVLLDDLVEKVSSGYVLVAEDDKRPPALIHVAEDNDFDSLT